MFEERYDFQERYEFIRLKGQTRWLARVWHDKKVVRTFTADSLEEALAQIDAKTKA